MPPSWQEERDRFVNSWGVKVDGAPKPAKPCKPGWDLYADPTGGFAVSVGARVKDIAFQHRMHLSDVSLKVTVGEREWDVSFYPMPSPEEQLRGGRGCES